MTDKNMIRAPFRMALRLEGGWYNAYFAKEGTMEGSLLIGSIKLTMVEDSDSRRQWQQAMSDIFERVVKARGLTVDRMLLEPAPEHERSGNA